MYCLGISTCVKQLQRKPNDYHRKAHWSLPLEERGSDTSVRGTQWKMMEIWFPRMRDECKCLLYYLLLILKHIHALYVLLLTDDIFWYTSVFGRKEKKCSNQVQTRFPVMGAEKWREGLAKQKSLKDLWYQGIIFLNEGYYNMCVCLWD